MIPAVSNIVIFINFKIHQEYIAKNLCVEKEIENNTCMGCCQLKKEINENEIPNQLKLLDFNELELFISKNKIKSNFILFAIKVLKIFYSENFNISNRIIPETPPPEYYF